MLYFKDPKEAKEVEVKLQHIFIIIIMLTFGLLVSLLAFLLEMGMKNVDEFLHKMLRWYMLHAIKAAINVPHLATWWTSDVEKDALK